MKTYSREIAEAFRNEICPECNTKSLTLVSRGWESKYLCINCKMNFYYTASDMGQTIPTLKSERT